METNGFNVMGLPTNGLRSLMDSSFTKTSRPSNVIRLALLIAPTKCRLRHVMWCGPGKFVLLFTTQ